ncbi:MAG: restriction endonuclease, partial [Smithella sp.]
MLEQEIRISTQEWSQIGPDSTQVLSGFQFDKNARDKCRQLNRSGQVELLELPEGLTIKTKQYVGSIQIDNIRLSILPKITGLPLLNLLRYAYNLRNIDLFEPLNFSLEGGGFQDILIQQLLIESNELIARGLRRNYERLDEHLASP